MNKTYYKVVFYKPDGKYMSSNYRLNDSGLYQEYFKAGINTPRFDFPMLAFSTLDGARNFKWRECHNNSLFVIWEVLGERNKDTRRKTILSAGAVFLSMTQSVKEMLRENRYKEWRIRKIPEGTIFLDSLEFVKEIE